MGTMPKNLADLLASAEGSAAEGSIDAAALAARVRTIAHRRRRIRRLATAVTTIVTLVVLSVLAWNHRWSPQRPIVQNPVPAPATAARLDAARAELLALRAESRRREALVDRMLADERRRLAADELRQIRSSPDALQRLRHEQDRAALVLIHQADRFSRDTRHKESAASGYRRVVELFPRSQWAAVARQRLDQLPG